jgi:putative ABC transport system permease protein
MWADIRHSIRALLRTPGFAVVAVLSLALGIGASTAIFSLLYQVLLKSLPVRDAQQLVLLHSDGPHPGGASSDHDETVFSYPLFRELRARGQVFHGITARAGNAAGFASGGQTEHVNLDLVSGEFFDVLGLHPAAGRLLERTDEGDAGANPVIVLSYAFWQNHFGGSLGAVNSKVLLNGHPFTVVGIAPPRFRGVLSGNPCDGWIPLTMTGTLNPSNADDLKSPSQHWLAVFARLKKGSQPGAAAAQINPAFQSILRGEVDQMKIGSGPMRQRWLARKIELRPAAQGLNMLSREFRKPLVFLMAMVGLLLLIGCANIANLLIARATARSREMAIRLAIGASRGSLMKQLLTESLILSLSGGALGVGVAYAITAALLHMLPADEAGGWLQASVDVNVLLFSIAVSVAVGLASGLIPAWQATRPDVTTALKEQSGGASASKSHAQFRRGLVVLQFALSLLLLIGAGLMARSFVNLATHNPGFAPDHLLTFGVVPRLSAYTPERADSLYRQIGEKLEALPGVRRVASAGYAPFSGTTRTTNVSAEGHPFRDEEDTDCGINSVSPGYFRTVGLTLLEGREFQASDTRDAPKVAIVNEAFARYFFSGRSPLGRHMSQGGSSSPKLDIEIVGVARDSQYDNLREKVGRFYYIPYDQDSSHQRMIYFLRTSQAPEALAGAVRAAVAQLDPTVPVLNLKTMQVKIDESIYTDRLIATLATAFGALATLLAAMGLYGVIAYMVTRRTTEIGIRVAVGAGQADVLMLVLREVGLLVIAGLVLGIPLARLAGGYVESQLFGVQAADLGVYVTASAALVITAFLAAWGPTARAARIQPLKALRYE